MSCSSYLSVCHCLCSCSVDTTFYCDLSSCCVIFVLLTLKMAKLTSPLALMMAAMSGTPDEGVLGGHNCVMLSHSTLSVSEIPLDIPELNLFTDGSAHILYGSRCAGWTFGSSHGVIPQGNLPDYYSAQVSDLVTIACILGTGCSATIHRFTKWCSAVFDDNVHFDSCRYNY